MAKRDLLDTRRLEGLSDGIFAFAMTLLILNFNLPERVKDIRGFDLGAYLMNQQDPFFNYFLSFFFLAVFWLIHQQQMHHIKKTDRRHLWLNIFMLMFVVFIPFSTSLVNEFADHTSAEFFFAANMFIVSTLLYFGWIYSTGNKDMITGSTKEAHVRSGRVSGLVIPVISVISMTFAFIYPVVCSYLYLAIPVGMWLSSLYCRNKPC
jgi:uncharacterized membrane protein